MKLLGAIVFLVLAVNISLVRADDAANLVFFKPLSKTFDSPSDPITASKVELGRKLYFETALSQDRDLSCNSCHGLTTFGVDNQKTSTGHKGQKGDRNSPTVYNAALHFLQFWDGRAKDVEAQALGPILNPVEMAMASDVSVIERIKVLKPYQVLFAKAFPDQSDPINYTNVGRAIGAFERTLSTPSRFDSYLSGDEKALTAAELDGLNTFVSSGCVTCHMGEGVGGGMFQKLGLVKPYQTEDLGRYKVTKQESDKYFFKVPSLRNIEKTAPYLHDGSIEKLEDVVKIMAEYQLGKTLEENQVKSIVTFLRTLTGSHKEMGIKG